MTTPSPPSAASAAFAPADAWPAALTLSPFLVRLLAARPEIGDWLRAHADRPVDRAAMHAFLAAEDKNFYSHQGFDARGMAAALSVLLAVGKGKEKICCKKEK